MKIGVLMSGGVDSSVAAWLLKQQGHEVWGITMINWNEEILTPAKAAADALGIPLKVFDLRDAFKKQVVDYFCRVYEQGRTPNPCVVCNQTIKFGLLLEKTLTLGLDKVATGHYARILQNGSYQLHTGLDPHKDQSYFLYRLNQSQLSRLLFPLGELTKPSVRKIAEENRLPASQIKDSQEICFITGDYQDFLESRIQYAPGDFIDLSGAWLGTHRGLPFYTVGQRKGLGISARHPLYTLSLDPAQNQITLGSQEKLFSRVLQLQDLCWTDEPIPENTPLEAKIRYAAPRAEASFVQTTEGLTVTFRKPQRAITPGQSAVFYQGSKVLGGGVIA